MQIEQLYQLYLKHPKVITDSRKIEEGCIFFALKGTSFNGNKYAQEALKNGAAYAIIDEKEYQQSEKNILVSDVLGCLQQLATFHRMQFDIPIIAVTGSNGKTTTKEILWQVLSKKYKTHATKGNFNNHIGVPLTLLEMPLETEIALIEMGDNHVGEVIELCEYAKPNYGFITNIGKDHIEGFGSFEANIRAKSEIFDYLLKTKGTAFINSQDPILKNMGKRFDHPIYYGNEYDFSNLTFLGASPFIKYKDRQETEVQTQLLGAYNFENIQTSFCIGKYFEVTNTAIHEAIAGYVPDNNRSQFLVKGTNEIVLDAYNANPSSVEAALENFAQFETPKTKIVILGDMFELGTISAEEHLRMIEIASEKGLKAIFCGERYAAHQNEKATFFASRTDLLAFMKEHKIENSLILIKGSRSMKLEEVLAYLD